MRHHPTPGAFWFTGREDECAVSEALPMPRCSSCLPACCGDPGLPAGEQPVLGNTASSPSALLRQHFPSLPLPYSPAGTQPLLGEPSPLTTGPAAAHGADCPLRMRKQRGLQGWGCIKAAQPPAGTASIPMATELSGSAAHWKH